MLKLFKPDAAEAVKIHYETSEKFKSQIPYQRIREMVKNHRFTSEFVEHYREKRPKNPLYLGSMDDDIVSLRVKEGLLTVYDHLFKAWKQDTDQWPALATTGYSISDEEPPIYKLGVSLDMKIREAMTKVFPTSPYYPEPNLFFLLEPHRKLTQFSFCGDGNNLESRRLIANGVADNILNPDQFLFIATRSLITTVPPRMRTKKNGSIKEINAANIGRRTIIAALRGLSQTHFFCRNWKDNIFAALPKSCRKKVIERRLMDLFAEYDPASLSISLAGANLKNYSYKYLKEILILYPNYVELSKQVLRGNITIEKGKKEFSKGKVHPIFFEAHMSKLIHIQRDIFIGGLGSEWTIKCMETARATGQTIHHFFLNATKAEVK